MMNWSAIPNLVATALFLCAFASVLCRNQMRSLNAWLGGWIFIFIHYVAALLYFLPGTRGTVANAIADVSLLFAALTFQRAAVSYRKTFTSQIMFFLLAFCSALYMLLFEFGFARQPYLDMCALLIGLAPLVNFIAFPDMQRMILRRYTVCSSLFLGISLLILHHQNVVTFDFGPVFLMFVIYFGTALHFWFSFRRASVGSIITIFSFFCWSLIFPLNYWYIHAHPAFQIENEIWNLPRYLVAIGMILLMLENQIKQSQYLALHDDLTGLPNRRLFQDRLDMAIARAQRSRGQLALLLIDLDHFKNVNDSFGHHAGDEVLRRVSSAFLSRLRRSDTLARTGGDEFSLILEDPDQAASAEMVAESLHQLLQEPLCIDKNNLSISASIGIAYFPQDASNMDELCIIADDRMYCSKNKGRLELQNGTMQNVRDMQI
jgi:diguanylate cyclase (GGDEF)-like protein